MCASYCTCNYCTYNLIACIDLSFATQTFGAGVGGKRGSWDNESQCVQCNLRFWLTLGAGEFQEVRGGMLCRHQGSCPTVSIAESRSSWLAICLIVLTRICLTERALQCAKIWDLQKLNRYLGRSQLTLANLRGPALRGFQQRLGLETTHPGLRPQRLCFVVHLLLWATCWICSCLTVLGVPDAHRSFQPGQETWGLTDLPRKLIEVGRPWHCRTSLFCSPGTAAHWPRSRDNLGSWADVPTGPCLWRWSCCLQVLT